MPNNDLINIANVLSERLNTNSPTSLADMVIENGQKKQLNYEIMFQLLMGECEKHILENVGNPIVDVFDRTNQNLIIVQDENGNSFGLQKINRKRKKFETANFKIAHNDLYNKFTTELSYSEYKAIGDNNAQ